MSKEQQPNGASLGTVILFTTQMEALSEFYCQGLGIGPYQESPKHRGCLVGTVYFGFDQVDDATEKAQRTLGATIWFTVDDIHATFDRLIELGASVRYPPMEKPHAGFLASLVDLDGNIFGISQARASQIL
jgi:predicted enzyme related to lactoylglutathione lyase